MGSAGPTTRPLLALLWASISPFVQLEAKWGPQGKGWGSQEPSPGRPKPLSPPCCLARPGGCIPVLIYGVQGGPYFPLPRAVGLQVDLPEGGLRPGHPAHTAAQRTSPRLTPPGPHRWTRASTQVWAPARGPTRQQACSLFCHQRPEGGPAPGGVMSARFSPRQPGLGGGRGQTDGRSAGVPKSVHLGPQNGAFC